MRQIPSPRAARGTVPAGIGIRSGPVMHSYPAADLCIARLVGASMDTQVYGAAALATAFTEAGTTDMEPMANAARSAAASMADTVAASITAADMVAAGVD